MRPQFVEEITLLVLAPRFAAGKPLALMNVQMEEGLSLTLGSSGAVSMGGGTLPVG
jgi:hypothetical protein